MGSYPPRNGKGKGNWLKLLSSKIKKRKESLEREKENLNLLHVHQQSNRCETKAKAISSLEKYAFGSKVVRGKREPVSEEPSVSYSAESESDDDDFVARRPGKTEHRLLKDRLLMDANRLSEQKEGNKRDKNSSLYHLKAMREDDQLVQFLDVKKEKEHFEVGSEFWGRKCLTYRQCREKEREKRDQEDAGSTALRKLTTSNLSEYDFSSLPVPTEVGVKAVALRPPLGGGLGDDPGGGLITHSHLSKLLGNICRVLSTGLIFMWVEKIHIPMAMQCMADWSFRYVENLTWVQVDAQYRTRCDKSSYLRSSHLTLLIARRDKGNSALELRHQRNCDVIVAPELFNEDWPNKVYQIIETLLPETQGETKSPRARAETSDQESQLPDLLHLTWNQNEQSKLGARWMRIAETRACTNILK